MKVIEIQEGNLQSNILKISHRFEGLPNIVCSGKKIYQLPCQVGTKGFEFKEIIPKYHICRPTYLIESKRYSDLQLNKLSYKVDEDFLLKKIMICPF